MLAQKFAVDAVYGEMRQVAAGGAVHGGEDACGVFGVDLPEEGHATVVFGGRIERGTKGCVGGQSAGEGRVGRGDGGLEREQGVYCLDIVLSGPMIVRTEQKEVAVKTGSRARGRVRGRVCKSMGTKGASRKGMLTLGNPTRVLALRQASRIRRAMPRSCSSFPGDSALVARYVHRAPVSFSLWNDRSTAVVRMYHKDDRSCCSAED